MKSAAILIDDGTVVPAESIGHDEISVGEIVFNTSMTGYQEIMTDPSYDRQIITFTNPHIGNTGINFDDNESDIHGCSGVILRNYPTKESNWRMKDGLDRILERKVNHRRMLCRYKTLDLASQRKRFTQWLPCT